MQELADRCDVSRRLVTQIELGQANPSLVTVDKIARALGTDFAGLSTNLSRVPEPVSVFPPAHESLVWSSPLGSKAYFVVATEARGGAEIWSWVLVAGDRYTASPDPTGSEELFQVRTGCLTITFPDHDDVTIEQGGAGRLKSDRQYSYVNRGELDATFTRVVSVPLS